MTARRACAAALLALLSRGVAGQPARDALVGSWRGTSLCVNREAAPACNDEQVVYDIVATPGEADAITVKADKIVNGRREPMGDLIFHPDATTPGRYVSEIGTPPMSSLWFMSVRGDAISGGLIRLPSKTAIRALELRRAQGSE
jgi:hypothetical protein